ncbi:MAG: hypothetical protein ACYC7L_16390 [Nitrospirota bacterium]
MRECPPDKVRIAREILDYLARQPHAEDTLERIMQHRVPEKPTNQQITIVKEVVGDLVTQGLIEKEQKNDRLVYRVRSR